MATKLQIYKCMACGNIVELLHEGVGSLWCCNQSMQLFRENTVDASKEKHIPVVEKSECCVKVKVGSVPHPMEDKHFIEWIEAVTEDGKAYRLFLKPGQPAEAVFKGIGAGPVTVREYCNLHGLWRA